MFAVNLIKCTYGILQLVVAPLKVREGNLVYLLSIVCAVRQYHTARTLSVVPVQIRIPLSVIQILVVASSWRIVRLDRRGSGCSGVVELPTKTVLPVVIPIIRSACHSVIRVSAQTVR